MVLYRFLYVVYRFLYVLDMFLYDLYKCLHVLYMCLYVLYRFLNVLYRFYIGFIYVIDLFSNSCQPLFRPTVRSQILIDPIENMFNAFKAF